MSCDVFANIGATEYLLNSTAYGWWTQGRLYRFNDPDSACVYQPLGESPVTEAESRSRFLASVITGGMIIAGDDFTKPEAQARAITIFSNREILALARQSPAFVPLDANTGSKAPTRFSWTNGSDRYIAEFNFTKSRVNRRILETSLGQYRFGDSVRELWTGKAYSFGDTGGFDMELGPYDCAILWFSPSKSR